MGIYAKPGFEGTTFRGFLVSVFIKGTNEPVGVMRQNPEFARASVPNNITTKPVCFNTSLTHWTPDDKRIVFFEWQAPTHFNEDTDLEIRWAPPRKMQL